MATVSSISLMLRGQSKSSVSVATRRRAGRAVCCCPVVRRASARSARSSSPWAVGQGTFPAARCFRFHPPAGVRAASISSGDGSVDMRDQRTARCKYHPTEDVSLCDTEHGCRADLLRDARARAGRVVLSGIVAFEAGLPSAAVRGRRGPGCGPSVPRAAFRSRRLLPRGGHAVSGALRLLRAGALIQAVGARTVAGSGLRQGEHVTHVEASSVPAHAMARSRYCAPAPRPGRCPGSGRGVMPVAFLTDEQAAVYGRFNEEPTRPGLERFFFLDDEDRRLTFEAARGPQLARVHSWDVHGAHHRSIPARQPAGGAMGRSRASGRATRHRGRFGVKRCTECKPTAYEHT